MNTTDEINAHLGWLSSGDPELIGASLAEIQTKPFGHPGIAQAILPLLESTLFYRISPPRIFCSIRLLAGAALAAEYDLLNLPEPIIVRQSPLKIWSHPDNESLWDRIAQLDLPRSPDPHLNFKQRILGGLQQLYSQGELGLELNDYEMRPAPNLWTAAQKIG